MPCFSTLLSTLSMQATLSRFSFAHSQPLIFVFALCPTSISAYHMLFSVSSELTSWSFTQHLHLTLDARVRCHWNSFPPTIHPAAARTWDVPFAYPPPLVACLLFLSCLAGSVKSSLPTTQNNLHSIADVFRQVPRSLDADRTSLRYLTLQRVRLET